MSQLLVRPGRNAARQAKKLKEIRKVKGAIVWHEKERKKRQKLFQERYQSKQAAIALVQWKNEHIHKLKKTALKHAREDWQLGPLRPNRAVGPDAEKYGAVTQEQMQKPEVPVHTQKHRNEARAKRGLDPLYPLIVDDKKYFHIVKGDRVVVVRGRAKGKIGIVSNLLERVHDITIKGVNMQYYDSNIFNSTGEDTGPKRENELPIALDDVRLVVPYEIIQNGQRKFSDVIVEKVFMERQTTGIDPYTFADYGTAEIPKDHQYDPQTGAPIFNRYIAGTDHLIEWPWEQEEQIEDSGVTREDIDTRPFYKRMFSPKKKTETKSSNQVEPLALEELERAKEKYQQQQEELRPQSEKIYRAEAYDNVDTTRNLVEGGENVNYRLLELPFPEELKNELRDNISERKKDKDAPPRVKLRKLTERGLAAREEARARHAAAQLMKTPMQLRWEVDQAKKARDQKKAPMVTTDALMAALGRHVIKTKRAARSKRSAKEEELD